MRATRFIRESLTLRDGRKVVLRPIRPEDAPRLRELHGRLSTDSQYLRFFGPKPELTAEEADYLANVDFADRFAIVAGVKEDGEERIVAVGRFDIVQPAAGGARGGAAEPAIVVRDDYQRSGLGTAILERMREVARGRGIDRFQGEILAENDRMIRLLADNGLAVEPPRDGVVKVTAAIDDGPKSVKILNLLARSTTALADLNPLLRRRRSDD